MTKREITLKYLGFLNKGKVEHIINLFTNEGVVYSPLYGKMLAKDFYPTLDNDTYNSELILETIFENLNEDKLAIYFKYKWTLKNKKIVEFDVVDILYFNEENKITELKIIYDTVVTRQLINDMKIVS